MTDRVIAGMRGERPVSQRKGAATLSSGSLVPQGTVGSARLEALILQKSPNPDF